LEISQLPALQRDRALISLNSTACQNYRFWMARAILTVIVPGVPWAATGAFRMGIVL